MKTSGFYLFLVLLSIPAFCQSSVTPVNKPKADTINIKQMIKAEIERIRNKEQKALRDLTTEIKKTSEIKNPAEVKADTVKPVNLSKEIKQASVPDTSRKEEEQSFHGKIYFKLIFLVIASLGAALIIVIRRRKIKTNSKDNSKLKKNVMQLRDDKVDIRNDEKLNKLRKNLQSVAGNNKYNEETLSNHAKQLSVSKGELSLAARLKTFYRIKNARANK